MRNTFASTFYELAKADKRLCLVVADISPAGSISKFREDYPERFINTGVAEQVMIGLAAGMALRGLRPFAYTIATFALYRPLEMIRDDLCYQDLPVTVVGIGGGLTYSTLGATHQAIEDIAIASSLPNMSVCVPCDPLETAAATRFLALENQHPCYLRLAKAGEPILTDKATEPFVFGKIREIQSGKKICFLAYGPVPVKISQQLAELFTKNHGLIPSIYSAHTIKPLDLSGIKNILASHEMAIVLEEHVPHGGLGSRIKEISYDEDNDCRVLAFSLKDEFVHVYGDHNDLLIAHDFTPEIIFENITKSLLQKS